MLKYSDQFQAESEREPLIALDSQLRGLHFLYPQGKQQELHAKCTDDNLK